MKHPKNFWKDKGNIMAEARKYKTKKNSKKGI